MADASEYALNGAGKSNLQLTDQNIAQLRKELHNPITTGRELDEGKQSASTDWVMRKIVILKVSIFNF